jgi:hypothetical protein
MMEVLTGIAFGTLIVALFMAAHALALLLSDSEQDMTPFERTVHHIIDEEQPR